MWRRPIAGLWVALACAPLAGCGAERTPIPPLDRPASPRGERAFRGDGGDGGDVRFRYPANWALVEGEPPVVAHVLSGPAVLTVWAYRRGAAPATLAQARLARRNLVAAVERRDPTFDLEASRLGTVAGARAVELSGRGTIGGHRVRIRSVHVYKRRGEYVVDAYAPPARAAVLGRVLGPLVRSLRLRGRPPAAGSAGQPPPPPAGSGG